MEEYPDYTMVQSEAAAYNFVEQVDPPLFKKIQKYVKEGRLEPVGGMWVESDQNLPSGEALSRAFLLGQRYFMQRSKWQYYAVHPDATGNVGQFVMGNEPSFHIPYLYNYAGQPWKTQKRIRMLMESWFRNDLMGICGDEDGGGMIRIVFLKKCLPV